MADDLQSWFRNLPRNLQRECASGLREITDNLKSDVQAAAPEGESGNTKRSVRVTRGRNTLEYFVDAGGPLTTKQIREGSGTEYDYALGDEFGNSHVNAQPWFYPTARAKREQVRADIEQLVNDVIAKS